MLPTSSFVLMLLLLNICCDDTALNEDSKRTILFCIGSQILEGRSIVSRMAQVESGGDEGSPWIRDVDGKRAEVGGLAVSLLLLSHS